MPTKSHTARHQHHDQKLHMLEHKMRRYAGEGDCAYERALGELYKKLLNERLLELTALRNAGL